MNAIYIYSSVSGLTLLEKLYGDARSDTLPAPSALLAIHQASLMMKSQITSSPISTTKCLSIRKGNNLVLITELAGSGFIVAVIVDRLISDSFATETLRVIVEDISKLAVVSFNKRLITDNLSKSYYSALLRAASQVQGTFGVVSNHTISMVFAYPRSCPDKTVSLATPTDSVSPTQTKSGSNATNAATFISDNDTKIGWTQYFSLIMMRLSPFRSRAQQPHKVTPEAIQPCTDLVQPPPVHMCSYLEFNATTSSVDQHSSDRPLELELTSTAPVIVRSIVQHLQAHPRRAPWEISLATELYLYDPEDRSLSRPISLIESPSKDDREEVRPAAISTGPTTIARNERTKSGTNGGRKNNYVYAQQQRQAAQLRVLHFPEQSLVVVFQRKAGAEAGIEPDYPEPHRHNVLNSVELMDFQVWAKSCLLKKTVPGVKELPVDIL